MYINKVVFVEFSDLKTSDEHMDYFRSDILLQYTDYSTCEITSDHVQEILEEAEEDAENYGYTKEEILRYLNTYLGEDLTNLLISGEVDFCLVV